MENVLLEINDRIAVLTINREKALNALNSDTLGDIEKALYEASMANVKVVILTGKGKAFIAGADVKEMSSLDPVGISNYIERGQHLSLFLERAPFVTIAAVNGFALGGGLEMALACDFIYASEKALFGLPEVTIGLMPGFGGTQRLTRVVGRAKAKELIFTGRNIKADEALTLGIANKVVAPEGLLESCQEVASQISKNAFFSVIQAKRAINGGEELNLPEALELERQAFVATFSSEDSKEGMDAFNNKRKAEYKL